METGSENKPDVERNSPMVFLVSMFYVITEDLYEKRGVVEVRFFLKLVLIGMILAPIMDFLF